jgi:DNA/RNA endonuclease YhcR with UshA esterase domain
MRKTITLFVSIFLVIAVNILFAQQERFVRQTTIAVPSAECAGFGNMISGVDLDGDGKVEIYAVNNNWNDSAPCELVPRIYKFEFDGTKWDTVWKAQLNIPLQNTWPPLAVGDLDNDGKKEIIWGPINFLDAANNPNPPRIVVFEVKGDGSDVLGVPDGSGNYLPNAKWNMGVADNYDLRPFRWFVQDIDNDGKQEVIFASRAGNERFGVISVSDVPDLGGGTETWTWEGNGLGQNINSSTLYDLFILDGKIYLIHSNGTVTPVIFENGQWKAKTAQANVVSGGSWKSASVVDLNNDGVKEVVVAGWTAGNARAYLLQRTSDSTFSTTVIADFTPIVGSSGRINGGAAGDIDHDGKLDFVFGTRTPTVEGTIIRLKYLGGDITNPANYQASVIDELIAPQGTGNRYDILEISDVDKDGKPEVVYSNGIGGMVPIVILDRIMYYTLAQARVDANNDGIPDLKLTGDTVTVTGVVTTPNYVLSANGTSYYIQDHTAGINIFRNGVVVNLDLGDSILVTGKLEVFRGLTEVIPLTVTTPNLRVLKKNAYIPEPELVTAAQLNSNGEAYEGKLIKMLNLTKSPFSVPWPAANQDANMRMYQGADSVTMRIDQDTDIDGQPEPAYPVNVIGVATQFTSGPTVYTGGYQLQPRYYATDFQPAQAQVTFNVNMRVKILKGEFTPSTDLLVIRGNFNGWSGLADQLSDTDGDSIYSITKTFNVGDNLEFKFVIHRSGTDFWEDRIPNRTYTVQPGTNVYNGGYFNNDSIYVPRVPIQFTFSCNMELERLSGRFNPATDTVSVNGTFNGWASKQWILQPNALNPDLYEGTWTINAGVGESIEFKFWYTPNNWESRPNRVYTFTQDDINAGSVFYSGAFNDASLATVLNQPATIKFTVYTQGAVSVVNGQPFPVVNTVHIAGSALPLQWPSGGWPNSDSVRMIRLYDNGTNGDLVAGDKIFSRDITFPQYTVLRVEYKYSINFGDAVNNGGGNDNEAGFAQNHILNMTRFMTGATTVDTFGRMGDSYLTNITGVNDQVVTKPTTYSLSQNYPNPFNPTTKIRFTVPELTKVTLKVYNILGQEVATILENKELGQGMYEYEFNAANLTSGTYIYKMTAGNFVQTRKMILIK